MKRETSTNQLRDSYFEEGLKRAEQFRKAAEVMRKAQNDSLAEDCIDNAVFEEAMARRGPIGNLRIDLKCTGRA